MGLIILRATNRINDGCHAQGGISRLVAICSPGDQQSTHRAERGRGNLLGESWNLIGSAGRTPVTQPPMHGCGR